MSVPEADRGGAAAASYPPRSEEDRDALLRFIRETPIAFGTWRHLKGLYKQVEADALTDAADPRLLGALAGRMDRAPLASSAGIVSPAFEGLSQIGHLAISGDRAYVLGSSKGGWNNTDTLAVYDLATPDPMKPRRLSSTPVRGVGRILLCGPYACVYNPHGGWRSSTKLTLYDVSKPEQGPPEKCGSIEIGNAQQLAAVYPHLFFAGSSGELKGLRIVSVADPDNPVTVGEVKVDGALGVAASEDGKIACVALPRTGFSWNSLPSKGGFRIVDTSDPARPTILASVNDLAEVRCGTIRGRHAFVGVDHQSARNPAGMHILDLTDPAKPRKVGFIETENEGAPLHVSVAGDYAYLAMQYGVVVIVDIRNPAAPKQTGVISTYSPQTVAVRGEYAYIATQYAGLALWNIDNPNKPVRAGTPPSPETMGYMKRRARRLLRTLEKTPERYAETAFHALTERGRGTAAVDPQTHWVSMDLLFGGSDRFIQTHHGRGRYVAKRAPGASADTPTSSLRLRARDERNPGAWDSRLDLVARLLETKDLPWQTYEFAAKVLRANRQALPELTNGSILGSFLNSDSPLLIRLGARSVLAQINGGKAVSASVAADAYLLSGAAGRRRIEAWLTDTAREETRSKFGERLVKRLGDALPALADGAFTRRQAGALALLARALPRAVPTGKLFPLLAAALATRRPDLTEWLHGALGRTEKIKDALSALALLFPLPEDVRAAALTALAQAMANKKFDSNTADDILEADGWLAAAQWKLIAASDTETPLLSALWNTLLESERETPALRAAMASPDALLVLSRSGITAGEIAARLADRPFLVALLSPQTFRTITQSVPASVTLRLIAAAPDDLWTQLRAGWLNNLREGVGVADLWLSLEEALKTDHEDRLLRRVLEDDEIARTIFDVEDLEALLGIRDPSFGALLGQVFHRSAADRFGRDSDLLLAAATHPLPDVRDPALARVRAVGMGLAFALKLLESEVPPSVAAGRAFFEQSTAAAAAEAEPRAFDHALALCDSPKASVRELGRQYVRSRWEILPRPNLYRALFENAEPDMQAFVARLLNDEPDALPEETAEFDRIVLRTRHRARRAKELVKERQTVTLPASDPASADVETLLALARGSGTPRDAEWAMTQLARLALSGRQIDGLSIEGVAGG